MFRSWRALWLWCSVPRPERLAGLSRHGLVIFTEPGTGAKREPPPDVVVIQAGETMESGLSALAHWRRTGAREIPVILLLNGASADDMTRAAQAGFLLCVDGDAVSPEALAAVLVCAAELAERRRDSEEQQREMKSALAQLIEAHFRLRTPEEARRMAVLLAEACPEPQRRVAGFLELLVNAIEHGNLDIGYDTKSRLLAEGTWLDEVERRLQLPEHSHKSVEVHLLRRKGEIEVTITDDGAGFEHSAYLPSSNEGPPALHGRGISVARRLSFDELTYLGNGNQVRVLVRTTARRAGEQP